MGRLRVGSRLHAVAQPCGWKRTVATDVSADGGRLAPMVAGRNTHRLQHRRSGKAVQDFSDFRTRRGTGGTAA